MGINNHCSVCQQDQTIQHTVTTTSKTPLLTIWQKLMGTTKLEESLAEEDLKLCQDCFSKFNEYDEALVKFKKIESDLKELLLNSKDLVNNETSPYYFKVEYLDETIYLDDEINKNSDNTIHPR